jgi:hypothetical protein
MNCVCTFDGTSDYWLIPVWWGNNPFHGGVGTSQGNRSASHGPRVLWRGAGRTPSAKSSTAYRQLITKFVGEIDHDCNLPPIKKQQARFGRLSLQNHVLDADLIAYRPRRARHAIFP